MDMLKKYDLWEGFNITKFKQTTIQHLIQQIISNHNNEN